MVALIVFAVAAHGKTLVLVVLLVTAAVIAGTTYLFSSLEVIVADGELTISFGPGVVRRSFSLTDVVKMRAMVTSPLSGWGIHYYTGGVLYNVYGRQAVELTMRDGRQVRVGTDEPQALLAALRAATGLPEQA